MPQPSKSPWAQSGDRIIREPERRARTGVSRCQWWRMEAAGKAPRRVQLGPKIVGWRASQIDRWIEELGSE
jgi:prophage regulatory protein